MICDIARQMMRSNAPALAEHLRSCAHCAVSVHARYYDAPPALEQKIRAGLRGAGRPAMPWRALAIAASVLLAVSGIWNVAQLRSRTDVRQERAEDVLSAHLRSLNGTHLLDVPSSDQHTVKPWFAGKLDFSPPVKEVADYPLLGGRLEYIGGHAAAALVYGRRAHVINVFVWPSSATAGESDETRNGYHLRSWSAGGMAFWAVSDVGDAELSQFVARFRQN